MHVDGDPMENIDVLLTAATVASMYAVFLVKDNLYCSNINAKKRSLVTKHNYRFLNISMTPVKKLF